jgi:ubiquinone/menaquinone biosynthesis C-methylase UbiE
MGSQLIQGKLWGQQPKNWADIQEGTGKAGYDFFLHTISNALDLKLLDVGCGTGYFCKLANDKGFDVTGLDATPEFIDEAKKRVPNGKFMIGEMEELPFTDNLFDIVCGFNSFQYAANTNIAFEEAKRVLAVNGKLVVMIWGNKEDCEASSYLKVVGSLLPPPLPGAAGPFALSENGLLENMIEKTGFSEIKSSDIESVWDYADTATAMKGLMSAGPVARAIENNTFEKVYDEVAKAIQPYIQSNGHVVYKNKYRMVIAKKLQ